VWSIPLTKFSKTRDWIPTNLVTNKHMNWDLCGESFLHLNSEYPKYYLLRFPIHRTTINTCPENESCYRSETWTNIITNIILWIFQIYLKKTYEYHSSCSRLLFERGILRLGLRIFQIYLKKTYEYHSSCSRLLFERGILRLGLRSNKNAWEPHLPQLTLVFYCVFYCACR